jgi:hypothetical protein
MSYLLQYMRRDSATRRARSVRIDEYSRLNRPGLYGDAFVRVLVEDSTAKRRRRGEPRIELQIADCVNTINLEFHLETRVLRENSLYKIDTLLGALQRFRDALAAEAALRSDET